MFESHKDIINALFLVYYELSEQYVDEFYTKPREEARLKNEQHKSDFFNFDEQAERKLRLKYNLSTDEQTKQAESENVKKRLIESKV